jgi:hypothetical protein
MLDRLDGGCLAGGASGSTADTQETGRKSCRRFIIVFKYGTAPGPSASTLALTRPKCTQKHFCCATMKIESRSLAQSVIRESLSLEYHKS